MTRKFVSISIGGSEKGPARLLAVADDGTAWMAKLELKADSLGIGREVPGKWVQIPSLPETEAAPPLWTQG